MIEHEEFLPQLEIAQTELQGFTNSVVDLLYPQGTRADREHPVVIDGEQKIAVLSGTRDREFSGIKLVDKEPVESDKKTFIYEELSCLKIGGKFHVIYEQGTCRRNRYGGWVDTNQPRDPFAYNRYMTNRSQGIALRKALEGEPIDEFMKMQTVIEQIKRTREAKQKTVRGRISRLWRRG